MEVLKRKRDDAKKLEAELSAEEEEQAKTAQKKSVSDFMTKMKNKINNVNANNKDIDLELDDSEHHHDHAVMQPHAAQDTDQIRMKIEQQRKSVLQRQNLYNWKFSIADLVEILIAFIFNTQMKRMQIFHDLVVHKNWPLFTQLVQAEVASIVAQQIQR